MRLMKNPGIVTRATVTSCEVPKPELVVHNRHAVYAVVTLAVEVTLCWWVRAYS